MKNLPKKKKMIALEVALVVEEIAVEEVVVEEAAVEETVQAALVKIVRSAKIRATTRTKIVIKKGPTIWDAVQIIS